MLVWFFYVQSNHFSSGNPILEMAVLLVPLMAT